MRRVIGALRPRRKRFGDLQTFLLSPGQATQRHLMRRPAARQALMELTSGREFR